MTPLKLHRYFTLLQAMWPTTYLRSDLEAAVSDAGKDALLPAEGCCIPQRGANRPANAAVLHLQRSQPNIYTCLYPISKSSKDQPSRTCRDSYAHIATHACMLCDITTGD